MTKSKFPPKKKEQTVFRQPDKVIWSDYQKSIFREMSKGTGNLLIVARAGSSKTSVLVEGSRYIPKGKKILFCAFNKSIQEELKSRLGSYVRCSTLHALGLQMLKTRFGTIEVDNNKCWNIVSDLLGSDKSDIDLAGNICKTVSLCKANLSDAPRQIEEIVFQYEIDLCDLEMSQFIHYVIQTLRFCKEKTSVIDFDDMIFMPFIFRLKPEKVDVLLLDEAQDLNRAQIELALSAVKPDGRVIAVLDNFQAIYSWRGADSHVLDNLRKRLHPIELPLPICYRCPKTIVEAAQKFVPDIQVYDKAINGTITNIRTDDLIKIVKPGDFILSRYNSQMIKLCLRFLKSGVAANIRGRDFSDNMLYLVKKSKKKTVKDFIKWIDKWEQEEKDKLLSKYPKASVDTIADKAECFHNLCDGAESIEDIKNNIESLFQDNDRSKIVLFSSIHRAKGDQNKRVFILADTLQSFDQEELNLNYVGITRSQSDLFMVWNKLPDPAVEAEKEKMRHNLV